MPGGDDRLAGRRADADGGRLLPPLGRAGRAVSAAGAAGGVHDPDERHAARRGVGGVLQGARLPGRDLDRRAAGAARRLPGEQGRQGLVRPGDARARPSARGGGRVERADDGARRQRRPRPRGVPLPARRVRRALHPVHPDHRAGRGGGADGEVPWSSWRDRPLYVQKGELRHGPLGRRRAVRPLPDRRVRGVGAPRRRRGVRADVRRRPRELGRRAAGPVRPLGDVRARARARAHRRPLLVRPLRRAALQAREHQGARRCSSWSPRRSRRSSGSTSATRCRSTASSATCASPATAAAPRTASSRRPTASPGLNYLCAGYKAFFHHVDRPMRFMAEQLRVGARAVRDRGALRRRGRRARPQRPLHVRQRPKWKHCHGA